MSRPIKFRAWNGVLMLDVNRLDFMAKGIWIEATDKHGHPIYGFLGDKFKALLQFTGLHDRTGKEIWEGDILRNEHGTVCAVVWQNDECGFIATKPYDGNPNCYTYDFSLYPGLHEVLGNIYENPELLQ